MKVGGEKWFYTGSQGGHLNVLACGKLGGRME